MMVESNENIELSSSLECGRNNHVSSSINGLFTYKDNSTDSPAQIQASSKTERDVYTPDTMPLSPDPCSASPISLGASPELLLRRVEDAITPTVDVPRVRQDPPALLFTTAGGGNIRVHREESTKSTGKKKDPPVSVSLVNSVFGVMDLACYNGSKNGHIANVGDAALNQAAAETHDRMSTVPEWGIAPSCAQSEDENDYTSGKNSNMHSNSALLRSQDYHNDDNDAHSIATSEQVEDNTRSSNALNRSTECENVELIWEENLPTDGELDNENEATKATTRNRFWNALRKPKSPSDNGNFSSEMSLLTFDQGSSAASSNTRRLLRFPKRKATKSTGESSVSLLSYVDNRGGAADATNIGGDSSTITGSYASKEQGKAPMLRIIKLVNNGSENNVKFDRLVSRKRNKKQKQLKRHEQHEVLTTYLNKMKKSFNEKKSAVDAEGWSTPVQEKSRQAKALLDQVKNEMASSNNHVLSMEIGSGGTSRNNKKKKTRKGRFSNVMTPRNLNLCPIVEDGPNESTELQVRVPGFSKMLSDKDLIGELTTESCFGIKDTTGTVGISDTIGDAIEQITNDSKTDSSRVRALFNANQSHNGNQGNVTVDASSSQYNANALESASIMREESGSMMHSIRKSFSWKGLMQKGTNKSVTSPTFVSKSFDSHLGNNPKAENRRELVEEKKDDERPQGQKKPLWKEAVDAETGRVYYYHRTTRKRTWTRPPEEELQSSSNNRRTSEDHISTYVSDNVVPIDNGSAEARPSLWQANTDILNLLNTMKPVTSSIRVEREASPPTLADITDTETDVIQTLPGYQEAHPFDEPLTLGQMRQSSSFDKPTSFKQRVMTATSLRSGVSGGTGFSKISEKTELIKNLSPRFGNAITSIEEDNHSDATSISSKHDANLQTHPMSASAPYGPPPVQIPVPRSRELMVEEFTVDRRKDMRGVVRRPTVREDYSVEEMSTPVTYENINPYMADTDDTDLDTRDTESQSLPNDSISALSDVDFDLSVNTSEADMARRQALNTAIEQRDWDLAVELSEGMRRLHQTKSYHAISHKQREWKQSALDRFISENDWDAVAKHIVEVRSKSKARTSVQQSQSSGRRSRRRPQRHHQPSSDSESESESGNVLRRFGARSQLQHDDLHSVSSWSSSSDSTSEYSSEEYSNSKNRRVVRRGRSGPRSSKNFRC